MSMPRLSERVADANLTPAVTRTFADALAGVIDNDTTSESTKKALIRRVLGDATAAEAAPFESLWAHADLFLTVCIYVAVTDGVYGVEEARHISGLAHRLGLSARQLERLEAKVFDELKVRGSAPRDEPHHPDATEPGGPGQTAKERPDLGPSSG